MASVRAEPEEVKKVWRTMDVALTTRPRPNRRMRVGVKSLRVPGEEYAESLPDYLAAHFRAHDGQDPSGAPLVAGWRLVSLAESVKTKKRLRGRSWRQDWDDSWVPLAKGGKRRVLCVDKDSLDGKAWAVDTSRARYAKSSAGSLLGWLAKAAESIAAGPEGTATRALGAGISVTRTKPRPPRKGPPLSVKAAWSSIERWLRANAPSRARSLRAGATRAALARAERAMGMKLPVDARESILRHDGDDDAGIIGNWNLMSVADIVRAREKMCKLLDDGAFEGATVRRNRRIVRAWWSPGWIPFVDSASGHYLCIDVAPSTGGRVGQVIAFFHDSGKRFVVADSVRSWLSRLADDLERGALPFDGERFQSEAFLDSSLEGRRTYRAT